MEQFWERWYKANEIEQIRILEELPIFDGSVVKANIPSSLIASYFVDFAAYIESMEKV